MYLNLYLLFSFIQCKKNSDSLKDYICLVVSLNIKTIEKNWKPISSYQNDINNLQFTEFSKISKT